MRMESHTAVTPPSTPSPPAADAATLNRDVRATATRHLNVQRSNGGVSALDHDSTSSERIATPGGELEPTATAASPVNAAAPHGATHPTARPAMDAEGHYQNLSSQAGEEPPRTDVATAAVGRNGGLRRGSTQQQYRSVAHLHADTVAAEGSAPYPHGARHHHNHHHCHRTHRHTHPARARKAVAATAVTTTAAAPGADTRPRTLSQDLLLVQDSGTSDRSGSRGSSCPSSSNSGSHSTRSYDTFTANCSSAASFIPVQTPANLTGTAYHALFSPELSCLDREAIVERIVGHRPRAYHTWGWRKAKDYQELHALNVHKNTVYQQPTTAAGRHGVMQPRTGGVTAAHLHAFKVSPTASLTPPPGDAAGGVSPGSGEASLEIPLSTAASDPSSSPVARVVGLTGAGEGVSDAGRGATAESLAPTLATAAPPPPESPLGLHELPSTGSSGKVAGDSGRPHLASPASTDVLLELRSQLPMYTIPTSQQGPEYFKTAAQGRTNTLIIVMMGLPARGKTFLAQKICRLLGWHGSRAKMQSIQVAWRRLLLDWEAAHPEMAACGAHAEAAAGQEQEASAPAGEGSVADEVQSGERGASHAIPRPAGVPADEGTTAASSLAPLPFTRPNSLADTHLTSAVCNLATGPLNASAWCAMTASLSSGPALTSSMPSATKTTAAAATTANTTGTAGYGCSGTLSDTGATAGPLSSANTSIVCLDCNASSVCPSMQAHTASSLEDSTAIPASDVASASLLLGTRFAANAASDVTANGPRDVVARHSLTAAVSAETTSDGGGPSLEGSAGSSPRTTAGVGGIPPPTKVLRTRHFRELIEQPASVARRLYRYVLQSFAEDCRLFFQHGGEVVVLNDDFVTEELRQEAEALFRPLATQFFYIEVIRDAEEDPLDFVRCKIRDPAEYPLSVIDPASASDDFHERLAFLERVYETLTEAPNTRKNARQTPTACGAGAAATATEAAAEASADIAHGLDAKASVERDTGLGCPPTTLLESTHYQEQSPRTRGYVKIMNSNTIEAHGIAGYLASRIISYVMNLSQVKIQHPIYFVLHGESCYSVEGRIGGNPPLTEQGTRDAVALLEFLGSLKRHLEHVDRVQRAHHHNPQRLHSRAADNDEGSSSTATEASANTASTLEVWTSQLRRAIQTTELSERLLNIRTLRWSSLNEIHAGVCEDMTYAEVKERYPLIDYFSKLNKYSFRYPEGESYQDLVIRLEPVIMELENADKVVVVVAHQAVLRCLLAYFGSTSAESSIGVEVPHRTVWRCTYDSKGIAILDELKLDSNEADFQLPGNEGSPTASTANTSSA
ncbi:6-phosphofructo-2-kinase-like protein [Leishmania mexicana MHOM/GT/2001/U1103]|uniref:6-phosphofructo-2-kinase-like protein n=1 Tax=Leishmania mexicana (strain MHOM/GT/2001/U1103) TaxID=929439 RepID=E9AL91_LEIMU|nr:6-phosphofructo-2-kinase-like protein [Leishmania mexicana MHOM/GT/2001/U1103]CBZ23694.1 6-phosphofructo-2-kinase-like protein [Leishmania mexicana MHOM/GT/2001/U1103]